MRRIDDYGDITFLKESWYLNTRWAGQYALASLATRTQTLSIFVIHRDPPILRLVKHADYALGEPIQPLLPEFRRSHAHLDICTMW